MEQNFGAKICFKVCKINLVEKNCACLLLPNKCNGSILTGGRMNELCVLQRLLGNKLSYKNSPNLLVKFWAIKNVTTFM